MTIHTQKNAEALAERLFYATTFSSDPRTFLEAAAMLRQQSQEIERMKKILRDVAAAQFVNASQAIVRETTVEAARAALKETK